MAGSRRDAVDGARTARPTTADVARSAGVSTATVSYVLNNAEGRRISAATTEAVHRAARDLGYRPNLAARNLARGKSGAVLYVVPRFTAGDMPLRAGSRMTTELARLGLLQVQIFETDDDIHVVDAIANINPVAVTSLFPLGKAVMRAICAADIPHIEIGTLPALGSPQESVGELRIDHLVSRGHQRIAFAYNGVSSRRALGDYWLGGIRQAAESRGLPPVRTDDVTQENVADIVADWVRSGFTAVCAESDDVACVILYGLSEAGLKCPRDLAVIGVDATPMSALSAPPLTTVEFAPTAVADAAVSALLTALGYPAPAPPEPADVTRLIVRSST